jgi:antitoxin component of MazEF toxin-antitoxin module
VWRLKAKPIGNSLGVILPEEALARLNLKNGESLQLTEAPDSSVLITPFGPEFEAQMRCPRSHVADQVRLTSPILRDG